MPVSEIRGPPVVEKPEIDEGVPYEEPPHVADDEATEVSQLKAAATPVPAICFV